ncbi:hypothetical protein DFP73DRAFT_595863 [Morchella snyderi]|nr:hypothetical protein DFP73DRAFT_595863 [Morchella snyderi]
MQYITLIAFLFTASAIAAPIAQINAVGTNNYGDDGVPSKTDGAGGIIRLDGAKTANGKL